MSTLALRATVSGTEPRRRPATVPNPQVADNEQVRLDLLGQMQQRVDRRADNRLLFDVMCAGGLRSFAGVLKDRVHGGAPMHPVTLALPEAVGGFSVSQAIGGGRS